MGTTLNLVVWGVVLFGVLLAAGAVYQAVASARDARKHPPPGRLVEVGRPAEIGAGPEGVGSGHRLHLYEMGEGRPTVVFDAALGGSCLSWARVQPDVARLTRTASYDRAGLGWSEPGPRTGPNRADPRTAQRAAEQLHKLLETAAVPGPYVLVGHSFGGFVVRLFASRWPEKVAGLVLVDVPDPAEWLEMSPAERKRLEAGARLSRRGAWVCRLGIARLVAWLIASGALGMARKGVGMITGGTLGGRQGERILAPLDRVPAELRAILKSFWIQAKFYEALASQIESMPETARQVAACGALGDIPLVVLTASNPTPGRVAAQNSVARLSTCGKHVVAAASGHWVQLDEPELVVEAIREVVEAARKL